MSDLKVINQYQDVINQYPMLKLLQDVVDKYSVKKIIPRYHWLLATDNQLALNGYCILFNNNDLELSVVFGFGTYCDNRFLHNFTPDNQFTYLETTNAEIAVLRNDVLFYDESWDWDDSVLGWQTPDEIMNVIEKCIKPDRC